MSIVNKYNLPQETFDRMVKDGIISCSWKMYDDVNEEFKKRMSEPGAIKSRVTLEVGIKFGIAESWVRTIVSKFKE